MEFHIKCTLTCGSVFHLARNEWLPSKSSAIKLSAKEVSAYIAHLASYTPWRYVAVAA